MFKKLLIALLVIVSQSFGLAQGQALMHSSERLSLWPTIPFIRGQDLCQLQDATGRSLRDQAADLSRNLSRLLRAGADPSQAVELLTAIDRLTTQTRSRATAGFGMDALLEGSFNAHLDALYRDLNPRVRHLVFFNPVPLADQVRELRAQQRQGYFDPKLMEGLKAIAWGTYSFSPGCSGEMLVTMHIETSAGRSFNFQSRGSVEHVMGGIANEVFRHFQATTWPSRVPFGRGVIELVGAPGSPISRAPTPAGAEQACATQRARLPSAEEYEYLSTLGDWNDGVSLGRDLWALAGGYVLAPDLRNPSPVRRASELQFRDLRYYCVR